MPPNPQSAARRPKPTRSPPANRRAWAAAVGLRLAEIYPDARCELRYANPFELLIAVILSAQCTDKTVNAVTPGLFADYGTPQALAEAPLDAIEDRIRRIGLYRNKAKAIRATAGEIVTRHGGQVPPDMASLTALPGVGRKTANVVLGDAFGCVEGIVTDTHVLRVSARIGLTRQTAPEKVEADLMALFPQSEWHGLAHRLIWHGRRVCAARRPQCQTCRLADICRYKKKTITTSTNPPMPAGSDPVT